MKIAYCVQCHRNNSILREFIRICGENNDIYLHVDKKSNINDFAEYKNIVKFIEDRVDVRWAEFSQIQATLNTLEVVNKKKYDYIFLVSGDCLPLKNDNYIKNFLKMNKGKEFIGVEKNFNESLLKERVKYKYPAVYYKKNKNKLDKIYIFIRNKLNLNPINTYLNDIPKLYKGCNWFGISGELCDYILDYIDNNPMYLDAFKSSIYGDEVFFHTIVMNSEYKENIYNYELEENDNFMALRYIDWKSGPQYPRILNESDFGRIKSTNCIIGRKFSEDIDINTYREYFEI